MVVSEIKIWLMYLWLGAACFNFSLLGLRSTERCLLISTVSKEAWPESFGPWGTWWGHPVVVSCPWLPSECVAVLCLEVSLFQLLIPELVDSRCPSQVRAPGWGAIEADAGNG